MKSLVLLRRVLLATGAAVALWLFAFGVGTTLRTRASSAQWPAGLGALTSVPSRYPAHPASTEALQLVTLAAPLGVELRQARAVPLHRKVGEQAALAAIAEPLGAFVNLHFSRPTDVIDAPPAALGDYLETHAGPIESLRRHLVDHNGRIQWAVDLTKGTDMPFPNLLGHMQLSRLLAADALVRARRGDNPGAWEDLHAIWSLGGALRSRPEIISQLIALAGARIANALARKLPAPAPQWHQELAQFDLETPALWAMQAEAWRESFAIESFGLGDGSRGDRAFSLALLPYTRLASAGMIDQQRFAIARLVATGQTCAFNGSELDGKVIEAAPHWNFAARVASTMRLGSSWQRLRRYSLEAEGTSKIVALKKARIDNGGSWPATVPGLTTSRCSDGRWLYAVTGDSISLQFSREIPMPPNQKVGAPLVQTSKG
ncbi:MAG TPA: hypothetical protein VEZ11_04820 [Thermoanaerobaculia bacterium]|nr:hypothetical protein [Thermoanaerobaculia bacterium]